MTTAPQTPDEGEATAAPTPAGEVHQQLQAVVAMVTEARAMPLSSSCLVDRTEMLAALEQLGALLPRELASAQEVIGDREQLVAEGRAEAARIIEAAQAERTRMISRTELVSHARAEAQRLVDEAHGEAEAMRTEVEDYVDGKLANFEVVLHKTLSAVERGREKLKGRSELDALAGRESALEMTLTGEIPAVTP